MGKKLVGALLVVVVLGGLGLVIHSVSNNKIVLGYNQNYQPDQPIPFSHELHAGKYKMDCKYCHSNTEKSRHATVPSLNICMNCHNQILVGQSKYIDKLNEHFYAGKPVEWKKVHLLPDHVKFSHAPHIIKGKKACQECHGPVEKMPVVYQWSSLSMGWCVNCHKKPENNAPISCSTCHY